MIISLLKILIKIYLTLYVSTHAELERPYTWKEPTKYYYGSVQEKMSNILLKKCTKNYVILSNHSDFMVPKDSMTLHVIPGPPSEDLYTWWRSIPRPKQMRVDPFLCEVVMTKKKPIFKNTGCQLYHYMNPSAPRCQTSYLKWICDNSKLSIDNRTANGFVIPEADHSNWQNPPIPWIIVAKDSMASMCGTLNTPCGLVHTNANCKSTGYIQEAYAFHVKCPLERQHSGPFVEGSNFTCKEPGAPWSNIVYKYNRVFVVAEVDDTFIYHTHLEILPRIVYYLDFLQKNPDILILFGCDTMNTASDTEAGLRQGLKAIKLLLALFKISPDRIITHRHVFAQEIYLPMEGGCQDPVYNTWLVLNMRKKVMSLLGLSDSRPLHRKPVMTLLKRSSNSEHTRNGHDSARQWSDSFSNSVLLSLKDKFPQFEVRILSDRNKKVMSCFECQVRAFAETDILVGVHGAGLGMSLYMPPNSAVVEFTPYGNDGRCLLGGGPFSRVSALMGHNYMAHHPPYEEFKWTAGKSSEFNISRFVQHIESFLYSIDLL